MNFINIDLHYSQECQTKMMVCCIFCLFLHFHMHKDHSYHTYIYYVVSSNTLGSIRKEKGKCLSLLASGQTKVFQPHLTTLIISRCMYIFSLVQYIIIPVLGNINLGSLTKYSESHVLIYGSRIHLQ